MNLQDNLLAFGPHYLPGLADQDPVEALDATWECRHGRLPTDRSDPCGCWPQEIASDPQPAAAVLEPSRRTAGRTSRHRGVSLTKNGRWRAEAQLDGRYRHIGLYATENEAAQARAEFLRDHQQTSPNPNPKNNNPRRNTNDQHHARLERLAAQAARTADADRQPVDRPAVPARQR